MIARLAAWWRHITRDRVAGVLAIAERHEQALRDAFTAEVAVYEGDKPRCADCVIGWDGRADRSHLLIPCAGYPWCSPPRGRHHRAEDTVVIDMSTRRRV